MVGKWYKILGITHEMFIALSEDLKDEIIIWETDNYEVNARIRLTWFEALIMRIRMMKYNLNNPFVLKLERE